MAWLVCVKGDVEPYQYSFDMISVYEDDQSFPDHYPDSFNMLQVNGTKADVINVMNQIKPEIYDCAREDGGDWTFGIVQDPVEFKTVWRSAGSTTKKWYNLINKIKFYINIENLTPEEKQLLQTYDITHSSITSFIKKIAKSLADDSANNVEETDLRNTLPNG